MLWLSGPFINQLQSATLLERGERMVPFGPSNLKEHGAAFEPVLKVQNWNSFSVISSRGNAIFTPKAKRRSKSNSFQICNYNSKF